MSWSFSVPAGPASGFRERAERAAADYQARLHAPPAEVAGDIDAAIDAADALAGTLTDAGLVAGHRHRQRRPRARRRARRRLARWAATASSWSRWSARSRSSARSSPPDAPRWLTATFAAITALAVYLVPNRPPPTGTTGDVDARRPPL